MIDQGSTGIFSIPAKLAVDICKFTRQLNTYGSSQNQKPTRALECDQFPNRRRPLLFRDSNSVIALGANVPAPCPSKPHQVRHQERHGFKLSKMRSAINVRPRIAIRRAGNALVKSISTVFFKPTPSSTIPDIAPMGMDPYPNGAADTNPNCLNCSHGPTNQIYIEKSWRR